VDALPELLKVVKLQGQYSSIEAIWGVEISKSFLGGLRISNLPFGVVHTLRTLIWQHVAPEPGLDVTRMEEDCCRFALVVPTLNEAGNIEPLLKTYRPLH
jgi:hypothetical protein